MRTSKKHETIDDFVNEIIDDIISQPDLIDELNSFAGQSDELYYSSNLLL